MPRFRIYPKRTIPMSATGQMGRYVYDTVRYQRNALDAYLAPFAICLTGAFPPRPKESAWPAEQIRSTRIGTNILLVASAPYGYLSCR